MISIPSAKWSSLGSPLIVRNGRTAIDGLSGKVNDGRAAYIKALTNQTYLSPFDLD
jgi:hypothetical protein